jgi:hypothetical protein
MSARRKWLGHHQLSSKLVARQRISMLAKINGAQRHRVEEISAWRGVAASGGLQSAHLAVAKLMAR